MIPPEVFYRDGRVYERREIRFSVRLRLPRWMARLIHTCTQERCGGCGQPFMCCEPGSARGVSKAWCPTCWAKMPSSDGVLKC